MAIQTQPQIFYQPPQDPGAAPELAPIAGLNGPPSGPPPVFANARAMPRAVDDPLLDQINVANTRLKADQDKDARPFGFKGDPSRGLAPNHPGIGGKILHALSVAGNIAGDIFAPRTMELIPQTDLGRRVEEGGLTQRLAGLQQQDSEDQGRDATTARTQEETAEAPGAAEDKHDESSALTRKANDEAKNLETPQPNLAQAYATAVQRAIAAGQDPQKDPVVQHLSDAIVSLQPGQNKAPEAPKTIPLEVNGKPHQMGWNPQTNKYDVDMGESGEKPPTVNVNADENRTFQQQERGRGLLDKAEAAYRTAQQGANTMLDMVASARAGNKVSAQVLPLEGALAITTAQGVHRINRTEVDQYAGAGSLYDKIAGELGKVSAGQPIPPNILDDVVRLTQMQERGAYGTYKGAYDSATKRYGLTDEQPLAEPGGGQPQRPANVPEGYVFKDGPKGKGWYKP